MHRQLGHKAVGKMQNCAICMVTIFSTYILKSRIVICYSTAQHIYFILINVKSRNNRTTSAVWGSTIYRRVKPVKLLPHMAHSDWINCTGLTS